MMARVRCVVPGGSEGDCAMEGINLHLTALKKASRSAALPRTPARDRPLTTLHEHEQEQEQEQEQES